MLSPVIECLGYFSEALRPEVYVLDLHRHLDHNRSVHTYAGLPAEVAKAAHSGLNISCSGPIGLLSRQAFLETAAGVQELETIAV